MGCDIHMYVERRIKGRWYSADYFVPRIDGRGYQHVEMYGDRSYQLFATLANVRNYGGTPYISEPKGFPDDAADFTREEYESWGYGDHSHSWLTLRELIDFHEAAHPLKCRGMLSPEQLKEFDAGILPDHWCQGCNSPGYEFREWEEENNVLVPLINKLKARCNDLYMIYDFEWYSKREEVQREIRKKSEDIRIVFWFDN